MGKCLQINGFYRYLVTVTCKQCGVCWEKRRDSMKEWAGKCASCSRKGDWSTEQRARQSILSRNQVIRQGGIPNRKVFTSERVRGAANCNWKGGTSYTRFHFRKLPLYKVWRQAVFLRDNFRCVLCGVRGGDLNADHIVPVSEDPSLALVLDNGRTLCVGCHQQTPTWGWKQAKRARTAPHTVGECVPKQSDDEPAYTVAAYL